MNFFDWIPSLTTTSLLAFALWMSRRLIETRLTRSVQHEFEVKIESLKADVRSREAEIEALRQGALAGLTSRNAALFKRRLDASDRLWSAVVELAPARGAAAWVSVVKFDAMLTEASRNPELRTIFNVLWKPLEGFAWPMEAYKERPFVSPLAWAIYLAYQAVLGMSATQLSQLRTGFKTSKPIFDVEKTATLLKAVLPHQSEYIDKWGASAFYYLLDELEDALIRELRRALETDESDQLSVAQASKILHAVEEVRKKSAEAQGSPPQI